MKRTVGCLAVLVVVALAVWLLGQTTPAAVSAVDPHATLPPSVASAAGTVEHALAQAKQSGKNVPITLTFSDADLTAAARTQFPQTYGGITLSAPAVRLGAGQVDLTALAAYGFIQSGVDARGTPAVAGGRPTVQLTSVTIGGAAAPDFVRQSLATQLASSLNGAVPANLQVTSIVVGSGTLTVTATALP